MYVMTIIISPHKLNPRIKLTGPFRSHRGTTLVDPQHVPHELMGSTQLPSTTCYCTVHRQAVEFFLCFFAFLSQFDKILPASLNQGSMARSLDGKTYHKLVPIIIADSEYWKCLEIL